MAKRSNLWDMEGRQLLDGMVGLWCVNIGYGRKELREVAHRQMDRLAFYNTCFKTSHEQVIELSGHLAELTPEGIYDFFFANSGSEARPGISPDVDLLVSSGEARASCRAQPRLRYHGSTVAAASHCRFADRHQIPGPTAGIPHASAPGARRG
ncbi:aminotransferase class III-fold pyridoxal phosphate-dependent enzyme [Rhizobium sp. BT03]|uniref:aminotransferase class III-fold pyridoxal phosphate-dependent enzyme n=1 Tax=Rhizobium sp. BT03 TaxID=3045156 RepID=UPI0024B3CBB4|nr:aminotransferase class III-fold pyridoxal phosphate-dependent enzyme [Rhizobium sp. BT03]WHO77372.1 aminotransferase class III-fold pyridoxal phosphate-dependent enzyme [Rhizobium sp. BT03]